MELRAEPSIFSAARLKRPENLDGIFDAKENRTRSGGS
jgi:hypothetical protein